MKFEDFEKLLRKKGFGIAAFNHYTIKGRWHTYCVVLGGDSSRAFKAEATSSSKVFDIIAANIIK